MRNFFIFNFPTLLNSIKSESLKDSKNILSQSYLDKKGSIDYIIGIGDILSISFD